jgi:hypothetical protein
MSIRATLMYANAYDDTNDAPTGAGVACPPRTDEPVASRMSLSSAARSTGG